MEDCCPGVITKVREVDGEKLSNSSIGGMFGKMFLLSFLVPFGFWFRSSTNYGSLCTPRRVPPAMLLSLRSTMQIYPSSRPRSVIMRESFIILKNTYTCTIMRYRRITCFTNGFYIPNPSLSLYIIVSLKVHTGTVLAHVVVLINFIRGFYFYTSIS